MNSNGAALLKREWSADVLRSAGGGGFRRRRTFRSADQVLHALPIRPLFARQKSNYLRGRTLHIMDSSDVDLIAFAIRDVQNH